METAQLHSRDYWKSFAPALHVEDPSLFEKLAPLPFAAAGVEDLAARLNKEAYFQSTADWGLDIKLMAETVRSLSQANLSPVFAFLYDEFWIPFYKLHFLYRELLGGKYHFLPDFWVWNVDPAKGDAGWKPHRDKGRRALFEDGSPKSLTTWIPLSSSTPLNGCMYIVPAMHDPTYGTMEEANWKFEYAGIRALPGGPGDFFIWNQAVLHWGSMTSPRAPETRVSMAFEFQRGDVPAFNQPLLDPQRMLPFAARLHLIAKQILQYQHMYKLEPEIAQFALEVCAKAALAAPPAGNGTARATPANANIQGASIKPGRNDPCPCGSGKKYKQCHGRAA